MTRIRQILSGVGLGLMLAGCSTKEEQDAARAEAERAMLKKSVIEYNNRLSEREVYIGKTNIQADHTFDSFGIAVYDLDSNGHPDLVMMKGTGEVTVIYDFLQPQKSEPKTK